MAANGNHLEVPSTAAAGASKEGVGRYVLAISLALVVVAFAVAYLVIL